MAAGLSREQARRCAYRVAQRVANQQRERPDLASVSIRRNGVWFWAGFVLGAVLAVWGLTFLSMSEQLDWTCQRYSPVTGECTLLQHRDDIPTEDL